MMPTPRPKRLVQSVDRALAIVELLAAHPEGCALSAIARGLNLLPQTAQSLVRTLQAKGWVVQESPGSPYMLGPACHHVSREGRMGLDLPALARTRVWKLSEETGEYVLLAVLRGREVARLIEVSPTQPLMVAPDPGARAPHTMATGKLLMAYLSPEERDAILDKAKVEPSGPSSSRNITQLKRQLRHIRKAGFAECVNEAGPGIVALAAPVRDAEGRVVAAVGIALPSVRYSKSRACKLRRALMAAAADIENEWRRVART